MLRTLFVTASLYPTGAERHAVTVTNGLVARGHECHVVHIKDENPNLVDRVRLSQEGTLHCLHAARYLDRRAVADFATHIARIRPSVIVAANAYALMYCWLALRLSRLRVRLVVTYHSTRLLGAKEQLQMVLYRLLFWAADCSVFVCEKQRRRWLRRGVFSRRNEMIYNGVDTAEFCDRSSPEDRERLRNALGFSEADYVIGISAALRPEKNHVQLVDAVVTLHGMGIPARLLMIGDGHLREVIESRARVLKVERDVVITGFQYDVRPYIAVCDVMVLCSHTEAFSLAAIEAMAMGKPFVHSDVGGAAEMIRHGEDGFLFPVGDTGALVDRLARLADRVERIRMGSNARARVEALFSEKTMIDRYEKLLLELQSSAAAQGQQPLHNRSVTRLR
jgi:glycosyltransferase involved in cell wall biosynthesis